MIDGVTIIEPQIQLVEVLVPGPQGVSPKVSVYELANKVISAGVLTLDFAQAATFFVTMNQNITSIVAQNVPSGKSERIVLYLTQDSTGSRTINGWPSPAKFPSGIKPSLSPAPGAIDQFVIDASNGIFFIALSAPDWKEAP